MKSTYREHGSQGRLVTREDLAHTDSRAGQGSGEGRVGWESALPCRYLLSTGG